MHIFEEPQSLCEIDSTIPQPISNMVSKLMAKDVELRYKSAKGVMYDLDLIISECNQRFEINLGQRDISDTLLLPQKLYGRKFEYCKLLSIYNRIVSSSSFELVIVKGNSGMGKSCLVLELMKPVLQKGTFTFGKFDSSNSEPYSTLIEAVNMFCDNITLEDEITIEKYRSLIQDAVGEEGQLLTNIVGNLKRIIGQQPDIFESFGTDAKNRFDYVFVRFITAIASLNSPLVIAIDDLQWVDLASLDLIKTLVKSSIKNLMLIGLYRDNKVNNEHELTHFFDEVETMGISTTEIQLYNIDHEIVNDYLADALSISPLHSYPFTTFLHTKT